jgi:aminoglycoside phosphotransferase (APT) family kinase protein
MTAGRMHVGEIPTDVGLVRRLLAAQFPDWADRPIEPVESAGTDNGLYRLGDDLVARLPRIERTATLADKEYEWLPRLAPHLPLPIPAPLAKGAPDAGYPCSWTVCPWLEGKNPATDDLPKPRTFAKDLADFVRALHRIDPTGGPPAGERNFFRGVPLALRDTWTRAAAQQVGDEFDCDAVTAAWDAALEADPWTGAPVWLHGDLAPGNLLCSNGRLAAVIDFGGLGVGDPACDLIAAWNLLPADAREAFRATMQVDDATWARGRGWALSIALIQLPYYRDTNPVLVANSRHVIKAVLSDPS